MSDREESPEPQENGSPASDKSGSPSAAASHSPSPNPERKLSGSPQHHSRSRSHSYSRTYSRRHRSYSRSRSRSHSRRRHHRHYSRSHSRSPVERRYSRSRSRSYTSPRRSYSPRYYDDRDSHYHGGRKYYGGGGGGGYNNRYNNRSHNRSMSNRRHLGNRRTFVQDQDRQSSSHGRRTDNPSPSRCLGVFGLSLYTQEAELREVFAEYGHIKEVQVVYDAQSGRSRGFAFVYYDSEDDAKAAKDGCNGIEIDGRKIRVDFSITQRAHTPTPGIYMGKPSYSRGGGGSSSGSYRGGGGGGRRNSYRDRSPSPYYRRYSRSRSISPRKYGYY